MARHNGGMVVVVTFCLPTLTIPSQTTVYIYKTNEMLHETL